MNSCLEWKGIGEGYVVGSENEGWKGVGMVLGDLVSKGGEILCEVGSYWRAEGVKGVSGKELRGVGKNGIMDLIKCGGSSVDGRGEESDGEGNGRMKG